MSNKITYTKQILVPSASILGGYRVETIRVTRKAHNRKTLYAKTNKDRSAIGIMAGLSLGCLFLWHFYTPTINILHPTVEAQEVSAVTTPLEQVEGEVAKITMAGQAITATPSANLTEKQQILLYIVEKFGDRSHQAIAMLAKCENSKLDPHATNYNSNGTVDRGIFQINSIHGGEEMYNWKTNIDKAYEIYHAHNDTFYAWSCGDVAGDYTYKMKLQGK